MKDKKSKRASKTIASIGKASEAAPPAAEAKPRNDHAALDEDDGTPEWAARNSGAASALTTQRQTWDYYNPDG